MVGKRTMEKIKEATEIHKRIARNIKGHSLAELQEMSEELGDLSREKVEVEAEKTYLDVFDKLNRAGKLIEEDAQSGVISYNREKAEDVRYTDLFKLLGGQISDLEDEIDGFASLREAEMEEIAESTEEFREEALEYLDNIHPILEEGKDMVKEAIDAREEGEKRESYENMNRFFDYFFPSRANELNENINSFDEKHDETEEEISSSLSEVRSSFSETATHFRGNEEYESVEEDILKFWNEVNSLDRKMKRKIPFFWIPKEFEVYVWGEGSEKDARKRYKAPSQKDALNQFVSEELKKRVKEREIDEGEITIAVKEEPERTGTVESPYTPERLKYNVELSEEEEQPYIAPLDEE